jgi:hypothetical protein
MVLALGARFSAGARGYHKAPSDEKGVPSPSDLADPYGLPLASSSGDAARP